MATLKISELSVGDWVQNDYGDYVKVEGIWQGSDFNYHVDTLRNGCIGTIVPCNLHPIPITAEILEKNGFAPDEYSNKIWSFIAERELIQYFFVNHKLCIRNHRNAVDVDVLHIHQLQHALRLAGLDKEIVMPNK